MPGLRLVPPGLRLPLGEEERSSFLPVRGPGGGVRFRLPLLFPLFFLVPFGVVLLERDGDERRLVPFGEREGFRVPLGVLDGLLEGFLRRPPGVRLLPRLSRRVPEGCLHEEPCRTAGALLCPVLT